MGQAVQAAGVSNSDPCTVPLSPGNSVSQTALDELETIQVSCSGAISWLEQQWSIDVLAASHSADLFHSPLASG